MKVDSLEKQRKHEQPDGDQSPEEAHENQSTRWQGPAIFGLFCFVIFEITLLKLHSSAPLGRGSYFHYSQIGLVGFYLACGNAPRQARWWIALASVLLLASAQYAIHAYLMFLMLGILLFCASGWTYVASLSLSTVCRETIPGSRFGVVGVMLVIAIFAIVATVLLTLTQLHRSFHLSNLVLQLICFALAMTAQGIPLWATTRKQAAWLCALALASGLTAPFLHYGINLTLGGPTAELSDLGFAYGQIILFFWITTYPLAGILHGLGGALIDPSWKLPQPEPRTSSEQT